ncbi:MAG: hypothetical protein M3R48_01245 [Candidatus Dormibacteraeota bacterium]|nr:hypothetical protein [Candidatus Dormibacteraeota bacterium]
MLACGCVSVIGMVSGHGLNATLGGGCASAAGVHHVTLVVTHASGSTLTFCDSFGATAIVGEQVLLDSGIQNALDHTSSGDEVCQVDREPASYTSSCLGTSAYWALFTSRTATAGSWTYSSVGISSMTLSDGQAVGLRYDPESNPVPPASPAGACPASVPTPVPTARPTPAPAASHAGATAPARGTVAPVTTPAAAATASPLGAGAPASADSRSARSPGDVAALATSAGTEGSRSPSPAAPLLAGGFCVVLVGVLARRVVPGRRR